MGKKEEKIKFQDPNWEKLFFALTTPENFGKSDTAIAREIGIELSELRKILGEEDFRTGLKQVAKDRLSSYLGRVVGSLIERAVGGSVHHQRLVFELAGMTEGKFKGGFGGLGEAIKVEIPGLDPEKMAKLAEGDEDAGEVGDKATPPQAK